MSLPLLSAVSLQLLQALLRLWCRRIATEKLADFNKRELNKELLVGRVCIAQVAGIAQIHRLIEMVERAACRLGDVALRNVACHLQQ